MEILKKLQRDYLVPSCPAISQNIYMYPRAGEVIETAGQLGSCPQKVLANDASFCVPKGYRTLAEGALEYEYLYEQEERQSTRQYKNSPCKSTDLQGENKLMICVL